MGHDQKDGTDLPRKLTIQPNIGLDAHARQSVVVMLNTTLADEAILMAKTRSAFWHNVGTERLSLQPLLEAQTQQLNGIAYEIAERVRILGGFVVGSFEEVLQQTRLAEQPGQVPHPMRLLADHEAFIRFLREDVRRCYEAFEDHGTFALLTQVLRTQEKMAWMLRSCLQTDLTTEEIQISQDGSTRQ